MRFWQERKGSSNSLGLQVYRQKEWIVFEYLLKMGLARICLIIVLGSKEKRRKGKQERRNKGRKHRWTSMDCAHPPSGEWNISASQR